MLIDILHPQLVRCKLESRSQKKALEDIAQTIHLHIPSIPRLPLFKQLVAREQLGSTALGSGVAIPHCRAETLNKITGCLISLQHGIEFEAPDDQAVDILFALFVPEDEASAHLDILAELAEIFNDDTALSSLRAAQTPASLFECFKNLARNTAAAQWN